LRVDLNSTPRMIFSVTENGQAAPAAIHFAYPESEQDLVSSGGEVKEFARLLSVTFRFFNTRARELKLWVHRIGIGDDSEGLAAALEVETNGSPQSFELDQSARAKVFAIQGAFCRARISFREPILP
jgi:hypothetical protein